MKSFHFGALLMSFTMSCLLFSQPVADEKTIDGYIAQYAPYEMKFSASQYSKNDKLILKKLVQASEYLDTIFWMQTSKYGMKLRDSLMKEKANPLAISQLEIHLVLPFQTSHPKVVVN